MAEIFPNEGLTYILNIVPRNTSTTPSTMWMGLFVGQTAATVPASDALLSSSTTPASASAYIEEPSTGGYARTSIASGSWPAPASSGSGMRTTIASTTPIAFAESTGSYASAVNGFFVATASPHQSTGAGTGVGFFAANFSDTTAITVNAAGFTVRVAPFWHFDG